MHGIKYTPISGNGSSEKFVKSGPDCSWHSVVRDVLDAMPDGFNELHICEECINIISADFYVISDAL